VETIRCHTTTASVIALFAVSKTIESDRSSIITLPSYAYNRCLLSLPARSHVPAFARSGKQTCTCTYDSILSSVAQAWLVMNTHFERNDFYARYGQARLHSDILWDSPATARSDSIMSRWIVGVLSSKLDMITDLLGYTGSLHAMNLVPGSVTGRWGLNHTSKYCGPRGVRLLKVS
jgi:hypothetical protein